MPVIQPDRLRDIATALLIGAGAPEPEAATVARLSIAANLAGHDSHGIIMIPSYIERMKVGHIVAGAPWTIVRETPTTTVIDGNWGFGYVVTERAMQLTIDKARSQNVAAATVFRQGHIGRLASYPLMAIEHGMIAMITAEFGPRPEARRPVRRRQGAAWARTRSASRCRRISTARCSSTWRPRPPRPARSRWRWRAARRCRRVGSSTPRASPPPIRANSARAARCCRWAAPRATRATDWPRSSRSSPAC